MPHEKELGDWLTPQHDDLVAAARGLLGAHSVLVVAGARGSGRTLLARSITSRIPRERLLIHQASAEDHDTPYFAIGQIFPDQLIEPDRPTGQVVLTMRRRIDGASDRSTVLLLDAERIDSASLRVLGRLAESRTINLVATMAPEARSTITELRGAHSQITVPGLDAGTIETLLANRFRCEVHPQVIDYLLASAPDNYNLARWIADSSYREHIFTVVDGVLMLTGLPKGKSRLSIKHQPPDFDTQTPLAPEWAEIVDLVALLGDVDVYELCDLFPPATIDDLCRFGIFKVVIEEDSDTISLATVAAEDATIEALSIARAYDLYQRYGDKFERSFQRSSTALKAARWALTVRLPVPESVLGRATRESSRAGQYETILEILADRGAADLDVATFMEKAFALRQLGRRSDLLAWLDSVDPDSLNQSYLHTYAVYRVQALSDEAELSSLAELTERYAGDADRLPALQAASSLFGARKGSPDRAIGLLESVIASGSLTPTNEARMLLQLARLHRLHCDVATSLLHASRAVELLHSAPKETMVRDWELANDGLFFSQLLSLQYENASQSLRRYVSKRFRHARKTREDALAWSILRLEQGQINQAMASTQVVLNALEEDDINEWRGWLEAQKALMLALLDRRDEAAEQITLTESLPAPGILEYELHTRLYLARARSALGEHEAGAASLRGILAEAQSAGMVNVVFDAMVALTMMNSMDVLDEFVSLVDQLPGWPQVWRIYAHALADRDLRMVEQLANQLDADGCGLYANQMARLALNLSSEYRQPLSAAARKRLVRLTGSFGGSQTPPVVGADNVSPLLGRLTTREREICGLTLEGLSNAEIAEKLTLSIRTVGNHLNNIYIKLNVSSRRELRQQLRPGS